MNLCISREITEIILKESVTHKIIEKMPKKICILTYIRMERKRNKEQVGGKKHEFKFKNPNDSNTLLYRLSNCRR